MEDFLLKNTDYKINCRDAIRAYHLLSFKSQKGNILCGEAFNIAEERFLNLLKL